jgi:glycosyltransferase involved in cell wall biosynthesis/GT2 family glycosyltransferase
VGLLTPRLRVAVVNPVGELGGAELYLLSLLDATDRLEVEALLLRDGPLRTELERRGIPVAVLGVGRTPSAIARGAVRAAAWLRRTPAEAVLANGIKAQAVIGPAARVVGIPCVWIKHDHSHDRRLTPALARVATRVVATTPEVAAPTRREDVVVITPPRGPDPLDRAAARARLRESGVRLDEDRLQLVMLTRLTPYKGVDRAITALAATAAERWDLVVLGGDDPDEPGERRRLLELADSAGVGDRVQLLAHLDGAASLLSGFDALAVLTRPEGPRTPGREGFGMSAMEAMIAGLPVLAPDDDGPVAKRTRDGAGLLVRTADAGAIAAALGELSDDQVRSAMAVEARRRAGQFGTATRNADRLADVLAASARRTGAGLTTGPPVSVVCPVLNEIAVIDRLVEPVVAQLGPDDELILVDSGSVDGTRERLREWSSADHRVRLLEVSRCSIAASRNQGVAVAKHELIACTDAGCEPHEGWLAALRAGLAGDGPDMVVGTYTAAVRGERLFEVALAAVAWPDPVELRRASLPWQLWLRTLGPSFDAHRVDGRSLAFRKSAFESAGGFPSHLATAEDEAFGRAMIGSGARSELLVDATVTWHQRETVSLAFRQFRGYGRGGGHSRSGLLLTHDAVRAAGYATTAVLLASGSRRARRTACAALGSVCVFPTLRILRRDQPLRAVALVPVAQAVKDGGKLLGVLESLVLGLRGQLSRGQPQHR